MKVIKGEEYILKKLIEGDESAFKYFFDNYYEELCIFVNLYVRDESLSEDIVQNIFVDVWAKREQLSANKSLKSYLYSASKNKSLNLLRDQKNKSRIESSIANAIDVDERSADHTVDLKELQKLIQSSIDSLPARCREVFVLSREEDLSHAEISDKLGISVKTVENQITIAFRKIRESLSPHYEKIFILFLFSTFF